MFSKMACIVGFVLTLGPSVIWSQGDLVMKAMRDELSRSMERLQLEKLERPYFLAYRVQERTDQSVAAAFGSLAGSRSGRARLLSVEVRVGDNHLDNTNFFSFPMFQRSGVVHMFGGTVPLPLDDDYKELRRQIWLATDGAYKKASEDLAKKRAALQNKTRTENVPDFSQEGYVEIQGPRVQVQLNRSAAETLVRELSKLFRAMSDIDTSRVQFTGRDEFTRYVNSEGSAFSRQTPFVALTVVAGTQASDGASLEDFFSAYGKSLSDLPNQNELADAVRELGARLKSLRAAPRVDQYDGPVLFEGQAAAELFAQVFAPNLLALRRSIMDNPQMERFAPQPDNLFLDKLGARVLPKFLNIVDDPRLTDRRGSSVSGYTVDDDAVLARETTLVDKGILKTLLSTRNPVAGVLKSSGNRRGAGVAPSNIAVSAENGLENAEIRSQFLSLIKQRGLPFGILVRRLANPAFRASRDQDQTMMFFGPPNSQTAKIENAILAYKVFLDGHEELIRNAQIAGMSAASFKEIEAASKAQIVYTAPFASSRGGGFPMFMMFNPEMMESGGVIVRFTVPSLLFEDVTIKPPTGEISKPPVNKHPFFAP
jgi:PmbA/TldA metallopeptidase C-terminal domain